MAVIFTLFISVCHDGNLDRANAVVSKEKMNIGLNVNSKTDTAGGSSEKEVASDEVKKVTGYRMTQVSDHVIRVDFGDKTLRREDIMDRMSLYHYVLDDTPVKYAYQIDDMEDGVASVRLFATIKEGRKYEVVYNGINCSIIGHHGNISKVEIVDDAKDVYIEQGDDYCIINLEPHVKDVYGIDLTETLYDQVGYFFEYSIVDDGTEVAKNAQILDNALYMGLGSIKVRADYYDGEVDEEDQYIVKATGTHVVTSQLRPVYGFTGRKYAAISAKTLSEESPAEEWNTGLEICFGEDRELLQGLKLQACYNDNSLDKIITTNDNSKGKWHFESSDLSKLYVREDGSIFIYDKGSVQVYVMFTPEGADEEEAEIVDTLNIVVKAEKEADAGKSVFSDTTITLGVNTPIESEYSRSISLQINDQYGNPIEYDLKSSDISCVTKAADLGDVRAPKVSVDNVDGVTGKYVITFTGFDSSVSFDKSSATFQYSVKIGSQSKRIKVNVKSATKGGKTTPAGQEKYKVEWVGAKSGKIDCKLFNDVNSVMSAKLSKSINDVKVEDDIVMHEFPTGSKSEILDEMVDGEFYYKITKAAYNGIAFDDIEVTLKGLEDNLFKEAVCPENGGKGSYKIEVYTPRFKDGELVAYSYGSVASASVSVVDTTSSVQYVKRAAGMQIDLDFHYGEMSSYNSSSADEKKLILSRIFAEDGFVFKWNNGEKVITIEGEDVYEEYGISVVMDFSGPIYPESGDVYYIREVDFYIPTNAENGVYVKPEGSIMGYNKSTVKMNRYVVIK